MYAIVETGGKQYRVRPGDTIAVERLPGEPGETLDLGRVLLINDDGERARVGSPGIARAVVRAEVVGHARGEKVIVFRYKSKVRYRRKTGHRQALTRLRITDILVDGTSLGARKAEAAPPQKAAPAEPAVTVPAAGVEPQLEEPKPRRRHAAPETETEEAPPAAAEASPPPEESATEE
jgi:large subunit ribosomal protein L21